MVSRVADLEVGIKGSTTQLDRDLARTQSKVKQVDQQFTRSGKAVAVALTQITALAARFAGPAALLAVAASAVKSVQAFAQLEQEMLTLQGVIIATGGAAGRTAEEIGAMADSIANASLATNNAVRQASAALLTFKSVTLDTFDSALQASVDLSAVGFGSVQSAAVSLGIALENPTEGMSRLTRVGVTFTAAQRQVIRTMQETGRVADAQREILRAVEQQVGGAAGRQASGVSGAYNALSTSIGNFLEIVGGGIANITGLSANMRAFANVLNQINQNLAPQTVSDRIKQQEKIIAQYTIALDHFKFKLTDVEDAQNELLQKSGPRAANTFRNMIESYRKAAEAMAGDLSSARQELDRLLISQDRLAGFRMSDDIIRQQEALKERAKGAVIELQRELELLRMPELQRKQTQEARKAGVAGTPEAAGINAAVAAIFGYNQAIENAKFGLESFMSLADGNRTLLQSMSMAWVSHADIVSEAQARITASVTDSLEARRRIAQVEQQLAVRQEQQMFSVAHTAADAIQQLWPKQKAGAYAAAVVNTAQAITEALKLPFPLNWVQAGLVGAAGAAQVAAINSTNLGGGGSIPSVTGGGGAGDTTPQAIPAAPPTQGITIQLRGADRFTGAQVAEILDQINDATKNGHVLIATEVLR